MSAPTTGIVRFVDGLERSLWTVIEGAGAVGIYAGYQALPIVDVPDGYRALSIILIGGVLAGIKAAVAQRWGNGTAATLPAALEPTPASDPVEGGEDDDELEVEPWATPGSVTSPYVAHGVSEVDPDPDPDIDGDGRGDVTGRFKKRPADPYAGQDGTGWGLDSGN